MSRIWSNRNRFMAAFLASAACLFPNFVLADVINPAPRPHIENVILYDDDKAGVRVATNWNGKGTDGCYTFDTSRCLLAGFEVDWAPKNLPVFFSVRRNSQTAKGYFALPFRDNESRIACEYTFLLPTETSSQLSKLVDRIDSEFYAWLENCGPLEPNLKATAKLHWNQVKASLMSPLAIFGAFRSGSFARAEEGFAFSPDTFIPDKISQAVLDTVTNVCAAGGRAFLQLNGTIVRQEKDEVKLEVGRSTSTTCVDWQIQRFPGYQKVP